MASTTRTIVATGIKESPESKAGIGFNNEDGKLILSSVSDTGIFSGSDLQPGQEILSVNGTSVQGMDNAAFKALLWSTAGEVTIQARAAPTSYSLGFTINKDNVNTTFHRPMHIPPLFRNKGVAPDDYFRFVDEFCQELMPAVGASLEMDKVYNKEMMDYTQKQMVKGYIGFGQESHHEKKVLFMTNQAAVLHSNVAMVASNLIVEANATFNPFGIKAKLAYTVKELPRFSRKCTSKNKILIPTAVVFTSIGVRV